MNEPQIIKNKTVCFSGHRPEKLPDCGENSSYVIKILKSMLYKEIIDSLKCGYDCFITGLARGVDLWAGEIVLELKANNPDIKLVAAVPYKGHGNNLLGIDKWMHGNILTKSDITIYVNEGYNKLCMQKRNEFMVDNSCKLIAMISNYKSGTGQTIRYAKSQGIETKIFELNKISEIYDSYQMSLPI